MSAKYILVVDDEALMRESLKMTLERKHYKVDVAKDVKEAIAQLTGMEYDLILSDIRMPGGSGLDVLEAARSKLPEAVVVMMTAYGTIENNVEAMKKGAFAYIVKPFSADEVELVVEKVFEYQHLRQENRLLRSELEARYSFGNMVGKSPGMQGIFSFIEVVAQSRSTVLVSGESGTGKELVAEAIHYNSPRKDGPFIKINCAAVPDQLMESELFGHEKGAYTGAIRQRRGRFELADKGTLLLDEISEMTPALQAKLLRVLQEREFERVGGRETIRVDVRVIATTNRELEKEVREGRFREDLFYRLNVIPILLPPLRERKEDIPALVQSFLHKYARENEKPVVGFSKDVLEGLMAYHWPGNVRELENAIEHAVVLCQTGQLEMEDFPNGLIFGRGEPEDDRITVGKTLREMEEVLILKTLAACRGNRTSAADMLGVSSRTIRNKLNEYGKQGIYLKKKLAGTPQEEETFPAEHAGDSA